MSQLVKKLFLVISVLVVLFLMMPLMREYMLMHPYYEQFLSGDGKRQHLVILLLGVVCALLPVGYVVQKKQVKFWPFILLLGAGLWLFSTAYVGIKSDLFGGAWMKMLINTAFFVALGTVFIAQLLAFGRLLLDRLLRFSIHSQITTFLLSLALGLVGFLTIEYVLLLLNIAFPLVNWMVFAGGVFLVWYQSDRLQEMWSAVTLAVFEKSEHGPFSQGIFFLLLAVCCGLFSWALFSWGQGQTRARVFAVVAVAALAWWVYQAKDFSRTRGGLERVFTLAGIADIALFLLIVLCVWYLYNGFILAYIPYPTAWDANHAYMFMPKMFAFHDGYYWNEAAMRGYGGLWLSYITYWFSLFGFSNGFLGISADTIAIEMNFLSGLFVLIFGLGLVWLLLSVLRHIYKDTDQQDEQHTFTRLFIILGGFLLWQWMSSGMGAFLVFIDNKTDMGVLSLVIVALMSGFMFLRAYFDQQHDEEHVSAHATPWLLLSGMFFAFAVLAKPTATFDVLNFFLLLWGTWLGLLGIFAIPVLVLGGLAIIKMSGVENYFSSMQGMRFAGSGGIGVLVNLFLQKIKKLLTYGRYLLLRVGVFLAVMVGMKLLYYIPDALFYGSDRNIKEWVQMLLIAQEDEGKQSLLAQATLGLPAPATCSLQSEGLASTADLYKDLKPIVGNAYDEDVGRYVGYGWKGNPSDLQRGVRPFVNPRWTAWLGEGCHSFSPFFLDSHDAVVLCTTQEDWKSLSVDRITTVQSQLRADGDAYAFLEEIKQGAAKLAGSELASTYREQLLALDGIMQGESMYIKTVPGADGASVREVYLPYKYLNFFNITFNRSLQNLSSYYTDIGIVWLVLIFLLVVGLVYGIVQRERFLITIHVVTLFGWLLWLVVGGGILWYGIGIVIWTILSFLSFLYALSRRSDSAFDVSFLGLFVALILFIGMRQGWYNMVRIATQGGGGPFMRYKTNYGITQRVDVTPQGQIVPINTPTGKYVSSDVFALQFPHYSKFLRLVNDRADDEGVLIAGTYARYFIRNQKHVSNDQFLTEMFQWVSDNNVCRSYLRLQDKGLRYLAIDPNIGTVVQGAGNKGLFERFFARLNTSSGTIEQHGTMSMLVALAQNGYIRYVSSNNLGAKYAIIMPDSVFGGVTGDALTVVRAKMMIPRYFQDQNLISAIISIADQRVKEGTFFEDIADVIGVEVRPETTQKIIRSEQLDPAALTEEEKRVLLQFFGLRQQGVSNPTEYQKTLQNYVMQSLGAGNQVIVVEVVKS